MFAPLSGGHFTYFPKSEFDEVLATIDCRPVVAGYPVDGDVITSNMDTARYSRLVQKNADLENSDFLFKIKNSTGFQ